MVERNTHVALLLDPEQNVHHVMLLVDGATTAPVWAIIVDPPLAVAHEDVVHEPEHLLEVPLRLAAPRQHPHEPRRREQVAEVEQRRRVLPCLDHLQERGAVGQPVAQDGAHGGVGDEHLQPLVHVDGLRQGRQRRDQASRLVLADVPERLHAPRAQQLRHEDPPQQAPVVAVGREDDSLPVPRQLLDARAARPLREGGVVALQHLRHGLSGGHHDGRALADP